MQRVARRIRSLLYCHACKSFPHIRISQCITNTDHCRFIQYKNPRLARGRGFFGCRASLDVSAPYHIVRNQDDNFCRSVLGITDAPYVSTNISCIARYQESFGCLTSHDVCAPYHAGIHIGHSPQKNTGDAEIFFRLCCVLSRVYIGHTNGENNTVTKI